MELTQLLSQIFEICVIPLLGVLTGYLVSYIRAKREDLLEKTEISLLEKYINLAAVTVEDCVVATNQTYVDTLKKLGKFDEEAQKEAFDKTLSAVLIILGTDAQDFLNEAFGDINIYLTTLIESTVQRQKEKISE